MDEELLRAIYENEGFANRGIEYSEFKNDMNDPDLQKAVFRNAGFADRGITFAEFRNDLGFEPKKKKKDKDSGEKENLAVDLGSLNNTMVGDYVDDVYRAIASGVESGNTIDETLRVMIQGANITPEKLQEYIDVVKSSEEYGQSDEMREFLEAGGFGTGKGWLKFMTNAPTIVSESIAQSLAALIANPVSGSIIATGAAAGTAAGGVGNLVTVPVASALASGVLETTGKFTELLKEEVEKKGLELTEENVRKVLEDEATMSKIIKKAEARGITIGMIDGITGGIAGGMSVRAARNIAKGSLKGAAKAKVASKILGVEAVGGAGGEFAAQLVNGEPLDVTAIGLEAIAEIGSGSPNILLPYAQEALRQKKLQKGLDPVGIKRERATGKFYTVINTEGVEVRISEEEANRIVDEEPERFLAGDLRIKNDPELSDRAVENLTPVLEEQERLKQIVNERNKKEAEIRKEPENTEGQVEPDVQGDIGDTGSSNVDIAQENEPRPADQPTPETDNNAVKDDSETVQEDIDNTNKAYELQGVNLFVENNGENLNEATESFVSKLSDDNLNNLKDDVNKRLENEFKYGDQITVPDTSMAVKVVDGKHHFVRKNGQLAKTPVPDDVAKSYDSLAEDAVNYQKSFKELKGIIDNLEQSRIDNTQNTNQPTTQDIDAELDKRVGTITVNEPNLNRPDLFEEKINLDEKLDTLEVGESTNIELDVDDAEFMSNKISIEKYKSKDGSVGYSITVPDKRKFKTTGTSINNFTDLKKAKNYLNRQFKKFGIEPSKLNKNKQRVIEEFDRMVEVERGKIIEDFSKNNTQNTNQPTIEDTNGNKIQIYNKEDNSINTDAKSEYLRQVNDSTSFRKFISAIRKTYDKNFNSKNMKPASAKNQKFEDYFNEVFIGGNKLAETLTDGDFISLMNELGVTIPNNTQTDQTNEPQSYTDLKRELASVNNISKPQAKKLGQVIDQVYKNIAKRLGITLKQYRRNIAVKTVPNVDETLRDLPASISKLSGLSSEIVRNYNDSDKNDVVILNQADFGKVNQKFVKNNGLQPDDYTLSAILSMEDSFEFLGYDKKLSSLASREAIIDEINRRNSDIHKRAKDTNDFYIKEFSKSFLENGKRLADTEQKKEIYQSMLDGNKTMINEQIKHRQGEQRNMLLQDLDYLMGSLDYEPEFKYIMTGLTLRGNIAGEVNITDKDGNVVKTIPGEKVKRNSKTVGLFQELSSMVLPDVAWEMEQGSTEHPMKLVNKFSDKSYINREETWEVVKDRVVKESDGGYWVKFDRSNDDVDIEALTKVSKKVGKVMKNNPWCTGGGMSKSYLPKGDFYLFLDGNLEPQITIRYEGSIISELRGTEDGQSLSLKQSEVVEPFLSEVPNGRDYLNDVKATKIYHKLKDGGGITTKQDIKDFVEVYNTVLNTYSSNKQSEFGTLKLKNLENVKKLNEELKVFSRILSPYDVDLSNVKDIKPSDVILGDITLDFENITSRDYDYDYFYDLDLNNIKANRIEFNDLGKYRINLSKINNPELSVSIRNIRQYKDFYIKDTNIKELYFHRGDMSKRLIIDNSNFGVIDMDNVEISETFELKNSIIGQTTFRSVKGNKIIKGNTFNGMFSDERSPFYTVAVNKRRLINNKFKGEVSLIKGTLDNKKEFDSNKFEDTIRFSSVVFDGDMSTLSDINTEGSLYFISDSSGDNFDKHIPKVIDNIKVNDIYVNTNEILDGFSIINSNIDRNLVIRPRGYGESSKVNIRKNLNFKGTTVGNITEFINLTPYNTNTSHDIEISNLESESVIIKSPVNVNNLLLKDLKVNDTLLIKEFFEALNVSFDDSKIGIFEFTDGSFRRDSNLNFNNVGVGTLRIKPDTNGSRIPNITHKNLNLYNTLSIGSGIIQPNFKLQNINSPTAYILFEGRLILEGDLNIDNLKVSKISIEDGDFTKSRSIKNGEDDLTKGYSRSINIKDVVTYNSFNISNTINPNVNIDINIKNLSSKFFNIHSDIIDNVKSFDNVELVYSPNVIGTPSQLNLRDVLLEGNESQSYQNYIKSLNLEERLPYKEIQSGDIVLRQDERGAIVKTPKSTLILLDKNNADVTTPIHELAHEYEKVLNKDEIKTVEDWSGHKKGTKEFSEAFAKGAERFIFEGTTFNSKLDKIFTKLKEWFAQVIKDAIRYFGDINELNPAMKDIYSKMVIDNNQNTNKDGTIESLSNEQVASSTERAARAANDDQSRDTGKVRQTTQKETPRAIKSFTIPKNEKPIVEKDGEFYYADDDGNASPVKIEKVYREDAKKQFEKINTFNILKAKGENVAFYHPNTKKGYQYPVVKRGNEYFQTGKDGAIIGKASKIDSKYKKQEFDNILKQQQNETQQRSNETQSKREPIQQSGQNNESVDTNNQEGSNQGSQNAQREELQGNVNNDNVEGQNNDPQQIIEDVNEQILSEENQLEVERLKKLIDERTKSTPKLFKSLLRRLGVKSKIVSKKEAAKIIREKNSNLLFSQDKGDGRLSGEILNEKYSGIDKEKLSILKRIAKKLDFNLSVVEGRSYTMFLDNVNGTIYINKDTINNVSDLSKDIDGYLKRYDAKNLDELKTKLDEQIIPLDLTKKTRIMLSNPDVMNLLDDKKIKDYDSLGLIDWRGLSESEIFNESFIDKYIDKLNPSALFHYKNTTSNTLSLNFLIKHKDKLNYRRLIRKGFISEDNIINLYTNEKLIDLEAMLSYIYGDNKLTDKFLDFLDQNFINESYTVWNTISHKGRLTPEQIGKYQYVLDFKLLLSSNSRIGPVNLDKYLENPTFINYIKFPDSLSIFSRHQFTLKTIEKINNRIDNPDDNTLLLNKDDRVILENFLLSESAYKNSFIGIDVFLKYNDQYSTPDSNMIALLENNKYLNEEGLNIISKKISQRSTIEDLIERYRVPISNNTYLPLEFIEKYLDDLHNEAILINSKNLPIEIIEKLIDSEYSLRLALENQTLTPEYQREHYNELFNHTSYFKNQTIPEDICDIFLERGYESFFVTDYQDLSEDFINKWKDRFVPYSISEKQKISKKFIDNNPDKIILDVLMYNDNVSPEIKKYALEKIRNDNFVSNSREDVFKRIDDKEFYKNFEIRHYFPLFTGNNLIGILDHWRESWMNNKRTSESAMSFSKNENEYRNMEEVTNSPQHYVVYNEDVNYTIYTPEDSNTESYYPNNKDFVNHKFIKRSEVIRNPKDVVEAVKNKFKYRKGFEISHDEWIVSHYPTNIKRIVLNNPNFHIFDGGENEFMSSSTKELYEKAKQLNDIFGIEINYLDGQRNEVVLFPKKQASVAFSKDPVDGIKGFYDKDSNTGFIVDSGDINEMNVTTIHESFSHPFLESIKKTNKPLYDNLLKEAKTNIDVVDYVNRGYENESQAVKDDEYITMSIDKYVRGELDAIEHKGLIQAIKDFFKAMSKELKKLLKLDTYSGDLSPNLTLRELAQLALYGEGKILLEPAEKSPNVKTTEAEALKVQQNRSVQIVTSYLEQKFGLDITDEQFEAEWDNVKDYRHSSLTEEEFKSAVRAKLDKKIEDINISKNKFKAAFDAAKSSKTFGKIYRFLKREFRSSGPLDRVGEEVMSDAKGNIINETHIAKRYADKLTRLTNKFSDEDQLIVNEMLVGEQTSKDLSDNVSDELKTEIEYHVKQMRDHIDRLIRKLRDLGIFDEVFSDVLTNSQGQYINRIYMKHIDKNYIEKVPRNVWEEAKRQVRADMTQAIADGRIREDKKKQFLEYLTSDNKMDAYLSGMLTGTNVLYKTGSIEGSKDVSIIKKRKDIPKVIRDFYGEVKEAELNYINTVTKISQFVYNHQMIDRLMKVDDGTFFSTSKVGPEWVQINKNDSPTLLPFDKDVYMDGELYKHLEIQANTMSDFTKFALRFNGIIKSGKTIYSPVTQMRNFWSAIFWMGALGNLDPSNFAKSGEILTDVKNFFLDANGNSIVSDDGTLKKGFLLGKSGSYNDPKFSAIRKAITRAVRSKAIKESEVINADGSINEKVLQYLETKVAENVRLWNELTKLQVVNQSVFAREIAEDFFGAATGENLTDVLGKSTPSFIKKLIEKPREVYSRVDDFYRVSYFIHQRKQWSKILFNKSYNDIVNDVGAKTDERGTYFELKDTKGNYVKSGVNNKKFYKEDLLKTINRKSAIEVKNNYPNYSRTYPIVKRLKKTWLVGAFVSFSAEMWRTTYNQLRSTVKALQIKEALQGNKYIDRMEIYDGEGGRESVKVLNPRLMRLDGMKRLGLMITVAYATANLAKLISRKNGFEEDEEEDILKDRPPWVETAILLKDLGNGNFRYVNPTSVNPYGMFADIGNTVNNQDGSVGKKFAAGIIKSFEPFLGLEISTEVLTESLLEFLDEDNPKTQEEKLYDFIHELWKGLQPGLTYTFDKIINPKITQIEAESDFTTLSEKRQKEIIYSILGVRISEINSQLSFIINGGPNILKDEARARLLMTDAIYKDKLTGKELDKVYNRASKIYDEYLDKARENASRLRRVGVNEKDLVDIHKQVNFDNRTSFSNAELEYILGKTSTKPKFVVNNYNAEKSSRGGTRGKSRSSRKTSR